MSLEWSTSFASSTTPRNLQSKPSMWNGFRSPLSSRVSTPSTVEISDPRLPIYTTRMKISGRTFIVTGGSSGLGLATTKLLSDKGANVAVLDLQEPPTGDISIKFWKCDVSNDSRVEACIKEAIEWSENESRPIAGAICCAGIAMAGRIISRNGQPFSMEIFRKVYDINVNGTYNVCRLVASHLSKLSPTPEDESVGILVLVSSVSYQDGQTGQTCYASTKGAIASLTLPMARDLARHKIRVVTIAPGVFESPMYAKIEKKAMQALLAGTEWPARLGSGKDFAKAVESSVENEMWNGCVLRLDGAVRLGKL